MEQLQAAGIAAGVVQDIEDLLERDPQLACAGSADSAGSSAAGPVWPRSYADHLLARQPSRHFGRPPWASTRSRSRADIAGLTPERIEELRALGVFE